MRLGNLDSAHVFLLTTTYKKHHPSNPDSGIHFHAHVFWFPQQVILAIKQLASLDFLLALNCLFFFFAFLGCQNFFFQKCQRDWKSNGMCLSYFGSSLDEMFRVEGATGKAHADGAVVCPQLTGSGPPLPRFLPFSFETLETGPSREKFALPGSSYSPFFFYLRLSDRLRPLSRYLDAHIHIHNIYSGALLFIISFFLLLLLLLLLFFFSFVIFFFFFFFFFSFLAFWPSIPPGQLICQLILRPISFAVKDLLWRRQGRPFLPTAKKKGRRRRGSLF